MTGEGLYGEYRVSNDPALGRVPAHWPEPHLSHLAVLPITNGLGEAAADGDPGWPRYIRTTDIASLHSLKPDKRVTLPPSVASAAMLSRLDLLMTAAGSLGTSHLFGGEEPSCYAGYLVRFRGDKSRVLPEYAAWWTESRHHLDQIALGAVRSTIDNFSAGKFRSMLIPLPPLHEQRAIVSYLDREIAKIDLLISEQAGLVDVLRERRASLIERSIASATVTTSGQRLKHLVLGVTQGWSPQCYPWPADGVENWGVLKAGAVNGGEFRPGQNKELPPNESPRADLAVRAGQLVVSRANTRELVGSAAVIERTYPRLMLCDKLYSFDLDPTRAIPRYVALTLGTRRWRDLIELEASGASPSMQNVSQRDIVNLPMDLPSLDVQQRLIDEMDYQTRRIDALIFEAERVIAVAEERRSALITAVVTGQVDVRAVA